MAISDIPGPLAERALLFEFSGRSYGLKLGAVEGLGEPGSIRSVAGAPDAVLGLSDWKGRLLTVVDLAALLGEQPPAPEEREPCLVRLASPLEHTALWVPVAVRLGWVAAEPDSPAAEPFHASHSDAAADIERNLPRFVDAPSLIRNLARAMEN
jgi:chemotaxis signal transduction protein